MDLQLLRRYQFVSNIKKNRKINSTVNSESNHSLHKFDRAYISDVNCL